MYKIKVFSNIAIVGLSFLAMARIPVSAATITFELSFFNETNRFVGSGEFSYNDDDSTCFELSPNTIAACTPGSPDFGIGTVTVDNVLTDFSATIYSADWSLNYYNPYWWGDENQQPGYISSSRYGNFVATDVWSFGDLYSPVGNGELFDMNITEFSDASGEGDWRQLFTQTGRPYTPNDSRGTWTATRVGEPLPITPTPQPIIPVPESSTPTTLIAIGIGWYYLHQSKTKTKLIKASLKSKA